MTVLQKFLKQIVLKQVKGSVYLVPAICDFQIEEALEEERKQGQNLPISNVSPRFFAFAEWAAGNYIRLNGTWIHKFADQRNEENYISTEELWNKYNIIFPNEG